MVICIGLSVWQWEWLRSGAGMGTQESNATTIRNLGFVIGGAIALVFAIWRGIVAQNQSKASQRQAETAQRGLLNERYQTGAEMLGNRVLSVRISGIYALRRLAEEHPKEYHVQISHLFCAFARHPIKDDNVTLPLTGEKKQGDQTRVLRVDVQDAMSAISARSQTDVALEKDGERPYLRDADINGVQLFRANLSNAWLTNANFTDARIRQANLSGARLRHANLSGTRLRDADLSNADLQGAILSGANLVNANMSGAKLSANGINPATGLTQGQLDQARADPDNPPELAGVLCVDTDTQLVWRGKPLALQQRV